MNPWKSHKFTLINNTTVTTHSYQYHSRPPPYTQEHNNGQTEIRQVAERKKENTSRIITRKKAGRE